LGKREAQAENCLLTHGVGRALMHRKVILQYVRKAGVRKSRYWRGGGYRKGGGKPDGRGNLGERWWGVKIRERADVHTRCAYAEALSGKELIEEGDDELTGR